MFYHLIEGKKVNSFNLKMILLFFTTVIREYE